MCKRGLTLLVLTTYFPAGGFISLLPPCVQFGKKDPDTTIVNIALSFKALAPLRAKELQQSPSQDRPAPVQLGALSHDITQGNVIPRQPFCKQDQPKSARFKPATANVAVLLSYNSSALSWYFISFFPKIIHVQAVSQNVGCFCVSTSVLSRLFLHFHAALHLERRETNEFYTFQPHLFNVKSQQCLMYSKGSLKHQS